MIDFTEWSYNNGLLLSGSAYLYNMVPPFPIPCHSIHLLSFHLQHPTNQKTSDQIWKTRVDRFITSFQSRWFQNGTIWEAACEQTHSCNTDQFCFKGFLAQYMALTALLIPSTGNIIFLLLASSASATAQHCIWDSSGTMCSGYWTQSPDPSEYITAVGPQMSALNLFNANLLHPGHMVNVNTTVATNLTGGTSLGDPNAGSGQLPIPR